MIKRTLLLSLFVATTYAQQPSYVVKTICESARPIRGVLVDLGSGVLVDPEYVLTCNHVIGPDLNRTIQVKFKNGDKVDAELFYRYPVADLVLLKLEKPRYETPIKLGDPVRKNDLLVVYGFSGGEFIQYEGRVGLRPGGLIRGWFNDDPKKVLAIYMIRQLRAPKGVSGGPVVDKAGRLQGVCWRSVAGTTECIGPQRINEILGKIPND